MKFIKGFFAINFLVLTFIAIMQYIETSQISDMAAIIVMGGISIILICSLFKKPQKSYTGILRKIFGWFFLVESVFSIFITFTELKEHIIIGLITSLFFGGIAFLLLRPRKTDLSVYDTTNSIQEPVEEKYTLETPKEMIKNDTSIENLPQITTSSKSSIQYIQDKNVIYHTDNSPIKESETPELIEVGYQEALQKGRESSNIKFKRTKKEEELSFQFMMNHGAELESKVEKFENCYQQALTVTSLEQKIALYEQTIKLFKKAQNYAYKSKGGTIYFQDLYEHMHNSHNPDFSYLDLLQNELNSLIEKRDHIIPHIKELISSHKGILQKDLYQYIPDLSKSEIQKIIRELENQNKIKRTKKDGSYSLELLQ